MTAFVLVHSPLVGAGTWQAVGAALAQRGETVVVPRLDNDAWEGRSLSLHHAEQVRRSVEAAAVTGAVVLVGHSGSGPALPMIGDALVHEVAGYVFVDSDLPRDRVRRLDLAPPEFAARMEQLAEGDTLPPWSAWWNDDVLATLLPDPDARAAFVGELRPLPLELFRETLTMPAGWPDAPCGYVRLSKAYRSQARGARHLGWSVRELDAGHLHMLVEPTVVAALLIDLAGELARRPVPAPAHAGGDAGGGDPVLATRSRVSRGVEMARRVGYGALAIAVLLFSIAMFWNLPSVLVSLVIVSLAVAGVTLLPAIILGYGVAAAEREDRERGRT